jgi:type IV pilus assembly protein PilV
MPLKNNGFSLIEVLVAVSIFSVGLLGIATLQLQTFAINHDSKTRNTATRLAQDLSDRMRANAAAMDVKATNPYVTLTPNHWIAHASCFGQDGGGNNNGSSCDSTAMAQNDLFQWNAAVQSQMSNGSGRVCIDSHPSLLTPNTACDGVILNNTPVYVIKIFWTEKSDDQQITHGHFLSFSA